MTINAIVRARVMAFPLLLGPPSGSCVTGSCADGCPRCRSLIPRLWSVNGRVAEEKGVPMYRTRRAVAIVLGFLLVAGLVACHCSGAAGTAHQSRSPRLPRRPGCTPGPRRSHHLSAGRRSVDRCALDIRRARSRVASTAGSGVGSTTPRPTPMARAPTTQTTSRRAAVVYLRHWMQFGDDHSRDQAYELLPRAHLSADGERGEPGQRGALDAARRHAQPERRPSGASRPLRLGSLVLAGAHHLGAGRGLSGPSGTKTPSLPSSCGSGSSSPSTPSTARSSPRITARCRRSTGCSGPHG